MTKTIQQSEISSQSWVVPAAVIIATGLSVAESSANDFAYQSASSRGELAAGSTAQQNFPVLISSSNAESLAAGSNASPITADWHFELATRIENLASKKDGWKGRGSLAATKFTKALAMEFLRKLALEQIDRQPNVGLDHEGTFSFFWSEDELSTEVTIYEDGTYSFFAKSGARSFIVDESELNQPLHNQLLSVLLT